MGRTYAGVLGFAAFTFVMMRGIVNHAGTNSTINTALLVLIGFAVIGSIIGTTAEFIVAESVRNSLRAAAAEEAPTTST